MFFSSRVVPATPPSFVTLAASACAVITGRGISTPSSDQVPELRNARVRLAGTAATADPVSWHAGATTGVPASSEETDDFRGPMTVPGSTSGGSSSTGKSNSRSSGAAHCRDLASTICVVVALVNSARRTPVSQQFRMSGIVPNDFAAASSPGVRSAAETS